MNEAIYVFLNLYQTTELDIEHQNLLSVNAQISTITFREDIWLTSSKS